MKRDRGTMGFEGMVLCFFVSLQLRH